MRNKRFQRLASETYSIVLADGGHHLDLTIARDDDGSVHEVAFVTRGKAGHGLDQMLVDLGVQISRAIQRRDPQTGETLLS